MKTFKTGLVTLALLALAACSTGQLLGGGAGAAGGYALGGTTGAIIGGVGGTVIGDALD